jgi:rSAM/selenodomain-associated transferase 1
MKTKDGSLLMIFAKNEVRGHVKTRLADHCGDRKALEIYRLLLRHTRKIARQVDVDKQIWYDRFSPETPIFESNHFLPKIQQGPGLGDRMQYAFSRAFIDGYEKVVVIGTDCADLTTEMINRAFHQLDLSDVVVGPAEDGGYYLLGMRQMYENLFDGIDWSTSRVLQQTRDALREVGAEWEELDRLNDVDTWSDWLRVRDRISKNAGETDEG